MNKQTKSVYSKPGFVSLVAVFLFSVSLAAHAQNWKAVGHFGWFGVGKAHQIEEGHFYWVGEFSGTFFSDEGASGLFHLAGVKCPAYYDLDLNKDRAKAGGYCIITDVDGDQAYVTWKNATRSTAPGSPGPGTFEYTGGTGKYLGISGKNRFSGITQVNWADGTTTGYSTWNR